MLCVLVICIFSTIFLERQFLRQFQNYVLFVVSMFAQMLLSLCCYCFSIVDSIGILLLRQSIDRHMISSRQQYLRVLHLRSRNSQSFVVLFLGYCVCDCFQFSCLYRISFGHVTHRLRILFFSRLRLLRFIEMSQSFSNYSVIIHGKQKHQTSQIVSTHNYYDNFSMRICVSFFFF